MSALNNYICLHLSVDLDANMFRIMRSADKICRIIMGCFTTFLFLFVRLCSLFVFLRLINIPPSRDHVNGNVKPNGNVYLVFALSEW